MIFFILFVPTVFFVGVLSSEAYDLYVAARNAVFSERFQSLVEGSFVPDFSVGTPFDSTYRYDTDEAAASSAITTPSTVPGHEFTSFYEFSGALAEWNGEEWSVLHRDQHCEVTGPGGIHGNDDAADDPIWATGWCWPLPGQA